MALLTIAKLWHQTRHPSLDEWINKCVIIHNEIMLAIKKNEIMSFEGKWMELETIIVNKISHSVRQISPFILYTDQRP
jgi:hypothetical protein